MPECSSIVNLKIDNSFVDNCALRAETIHLESSNLPPRLNQTFGHFGLSKFLQHIKMHIEIKEKLTNTTMSDF